MKQETFTASFIQVSYVDTERGPDIVRMPYIGQKRTISGLCTISEGLHTAPHNDIYIYLSDIVHVLGF